MTRSVVRCVSVTTWLAAAKLGQIAPSQFVRCEHSHWKACVQNSSLRTPVQFTCCEQGFTAPDAAHVRASPLIPSSSQRTWRCRLSETWQSPSAACAGFSRQPSAESAVKSRLHRAASCMQPLVLQDSHKRFFLTITVHISLEYSVVPSWPDSTTNAASNLQQWQ